ncbi:hypothetical protein [Bradyrhizobium sp. Tv2a-2]|uniref:hypothetical protein n=1 Tax=Bradyrhizobium sp. Tv2a-2 TaxID=113395 RepID=UPI0004098C6E|nr:hypothetical protein [Bradyrhizobium sp. Tv2a-2]
MISLSPAVVATPVSVPVTHDVAIATTRKLSQAKVARCALRRRLQLLLPRRRY